MRARLTLGRGEHDVVVDYQVRQYGRHVAASISGPEEQPEFDVCYLAVAEFNGRKRSVPWSKDTRFQWLDAIVDNPNVCELLLTEYLNEGE